MSAEFDLIVVGSGFGSLFFLKKVLAARADLRIAVVEWGGRYDHAWQIANRRNSPIAPDQAHRSPPDAKPWNYTINLGGGTNCWWGQTPRLLPADFWTRSTYGVLTDWPFQYDDLEPFYAEAEAIMAISGSDDMAVVAPRSTSFPLPPHRLSAVDEVMRAAQPRHHFPMATARAPVPLPTRNACCASARCHLCPIDAKFTAYNGMADVLDHPAITFVLDAEVREILHAGGVAQGVRYRRDGEDHTLRASTVVLGANAIQSPAILLRSGLDHPLTGRGLTEQMGAEFEVTLDGLDNFGGSTVTTGINFSLYDGPHRADLGAAMLTFENRLKYGVRPEFGRWRQYVPVVVNVEDEPLHDNHVTLDSGGTASIEYGGASAYAHRGLARVREVLPEVLRPLPVETIRYRGERPTESHLQCSLRAGDDPASAVVDGAGRHHWMPNLVVVGSATFPTCPPANPSLTVAAMALRTAALWLEEAA